MEGEQGHILKKLLKSFSEMTEALPQASEQDIKKLSHVAGDELINFLSEKGVPIKILPNQKGFAMQWLLPYKDRLLILINEDPDGRPTLNASFALQEDFE